MKDTSNTLRVSDMAESLVGSEIIKLAGEINTKIERGEVIYNFTIGDFNPDLFPLPSKLTELIVEAYRDNQTNYPSANGMASLREAISSYISNRQGLDYSPSEYLVAGGARPLIYGAFQALVDPGDTVVFPVPSWNNNHYSHLSHAKVAVVETVAEENFMPTADELRPFVKGARLIALCSPLNPTGTVFSKEKLAEICDLVIAENQRRGPGEKPLYLIYDQIYWQLTFDGTSHYDPVNLRPEMRPYTVYIDGLSKAFSATGVRVGWAFGPQKVMDKMKSILGHIGAWAPKAEQVACANFLNHKSEVNGFLLQFKEQLSHLLHSYYEGITDLKSKGFDVDAISPQAAIYLTIKFALRGKKTPDGKILNSSADITAFLLEEAKLAVVPFSAFGAGSDSEWFRLSVGTARKEEVDAVFNKLKTALQKLN